MRSLLFIPGDSPKKLDKGVTSGADAIIVDLEDAISPERKAQARDITLAYLKQVQPLKNRPQLMVRVNGLQTGLTDADLDVIVAGKPDAIMLPKAEGGVAVTHCDAKLAAREAMHGLAEGSIKIVTIATETAQALFLAGTFANSSPRLTGLTWGAEDISAEIGAETNRDAQGNFLDLYRLARSLCLAGAGLGGKRSDHGLGLGDGFSVRREHLIDDRNLRGMDRHLAGESVAAGFLAFAAQARVVAVIHIDRVDRLDFRGSGASEA